MPSVQHQSLELLVKNSLKPVCSSAGPFLTVYLPACHPGTSDLPRSPRLKAILRNAAVELERRLYGIRKRAENEIANSGIRDRDFFYFPSLSCRTIIYKGLLLAPQIANFYKELKDPDVASAFDEHDGHLV